jgi:hypothetical protein
MQIEVFDFLKEQRKNGNEDFWTPKQVYNNMNFDSKPLLGRVSRALWRLESYGYLEVNTEKMIYGHSRAYRVKLKYMLNSKNV